MTTIGTTTIWSIASAHVAWAYGGLCATAALGGWLQWRGTAGSRRRSKDPLPDLGAYKLAMLRGGPLLAITTVATQLRQDGLIALGPGDCTLRAIAGPAQAHEPLERELLAALGDRAAMTSRELYEQLVHGNAIRVMTTELTGAALLRAQPEIKRLR